MRKTFVALAFALVLFLVCAISPANSQESNGDPCPPADCPHFDLSKELGGNNYDRISVVAAFADPSEGTLLRVKVDVMSNDFPSEFMTSEFSWLLGTTLYPIVLSTGMYGADKFDISFTDSQKSQPGVGNIVWKQGETAATITCKGNKRELKMLPAEALSDFTSKIRKKELELYRPPPRTEPVGVFQIDGADEYIYVENNFGRERPPILMGAKGHLEAQELEGLDAYLDGGTHVYKIKNKGKLVVPPSGPMFAVDKKPAWVRAGQEKALPVAKVAQTAEELSGFGITFPTNSDPVVKGPCDGVLATTSATLEKK
jgi:hypothetical protein